MGVATSGTAVLSSVAASTSSVPLLSANSNRVGATVYNDSSATLFVAFAASASLNTGTAVDAHSAHDAPSHLPPYFVVYAWKRTA